MEPDVSGKPVDILSLLATLMVLRQMIETSMGSRARQILFGIFILLLLLFFALACVILCMFFSLGT